MGLASRQGREKRERENITTRSRKKKEGVNAKMTRQRRLSFFIETVYPQKGLASELRGIDLPNAHAGSAKWIGLAHLRKLRRGHSTKVGCTARYTVRTAR